MNADGGAQRNLTGSPPVLSGAFPSWSPDGARIAFVTSRGDNDFGFGLFVMNADGSGQRLLARNAAGLPATWSPDGKRLAFGRGASGQHEAIHVINPDGTGEKRLTDAGVGSYEPAWSPDGGKIAFTSERDENNEIYIMNPDGSGQRRLTHGGGDSAAWSPDGGKIAFARYRDENYDVYVINADGSGETRLTDNSAGDSDPSWQPLPRRL